MLGACGSMVPGTRQPLQLAHIDKLACGPVGRAGLRSSPSTVAIEAAELRAPRCDLTGAAGGRRQRPRDEEAKVGPPQALERRLPAARIRLKMIDQSGRRAEQTTDRGQRGGLPVEGGVDRWPATVEADRVFLAVVVCCLPCTLGSALGRDR